MDYKRKLYTENALVYFMRYISINMFYRKYNESTLSFRMKPVCSFMLTLAVVSFVISQGVLTQELFQNILELERRLISEALFRSDQTYANHGRFHTSKRICRLLCDLCTEQSRRLGTLCVHQCHRPNRIDDAISICRTRVSV